ncbi:hypothetical protein AGMMS49944_17110 [Spirochaetia bacterium]|nr:hypothetical protein AGMMS49944_17110 [Spirochaetia bacterium]
MYDKSYTCLIETFISLLKIRGCNGRLSPNKVYAKSVGGLTSLLLKLNLKTSGLIVLREVTIMKNFEEKVEELREELLQAQSAAKQILSVLEEERVPSSEQCEALSVSLNNALQIESIIADYLPKLPESETPIEKYSVKEYIELYNKIKNESFKNLS